jgi:hypothetical protein
MHSRTTHSRAAFSASARRDRSRIVVVLSFVALALLAFPTIAEATVSISRAEAIPKSAREVVPL